MKHFSLIFACVLACIISMGSTKTVKAADTVLEAEKFVLKNAEVVADEQASGKKAIKLLNADAEATFEVTLEPGTYVISVFEKAPDGAHDAFHIGINEKYVRCFPKTYNEWSELPQTLEIEVTQKSKMTLKIAANWPGVNKKGEDGMLIDKLVIKKK
jgi:hypothetical protein